MAVDLGKQVGPLPLGAWFVVVGAGLGLAYYSYRSSAPTDPEVTADTSGDPGVGDGSVSQWTQTNPPAADPGPTTTITTNEQWGVQAINWLIAQGYPASLADSAIRKYLAGNDPKPSVQEFALQGIALTKFGSPPQPLPPGANDPPTQAPPTTNPPPTTTNPPPPTTKPKYKYYTVKAWPAKGSTLWGIAEIEYGNGKRYAEIFNANRAGKTRADGKKGMISNANTIHPGWVLLIP